MEITFTDRYAATGTPYPNPDTMCHECEGMGCYPVHRNTEDEKDKALWLAMDAPRRSFRGFIKALAENRSLRMWRYLFRELLRNGWGNWGCDDWHFVTCPVCNGTRLRK